MVPMPITRLMWTLLLLFSTGFTPPFVVAQDNTAGPLKLVQLAGDRLAAGRDRHDRDALEQAVRYARRALEQNARYAEAHWILAESFLWLTSYEEAAAHLKAARDLGYDPSSLDLLEGRLAVLEGRFDDARRLYNRILVSEPYNEDALVGRALLNLADGSFQPTQRELRRLEQRYPLNRQLLIALVEISAERKDFEVLHRYLDLALRHHGDSASVQLIAAQTALAEGDLSSADFYGRNAVSIAPGMKEGWLFLAETARRAGKIGESLSHYETLIRMDPQDHRGWYARGTLAALNNNRTEAFQSWDRALSIRPDFEIALLAKEHYAMENLALEDTTRAQLARPYLGRGLELEQQYLFRQAEQAYRRGLQIYPFDTELRRSLAELYRNRNMWGRYVQELRIIADFEQPDTSLSDAIETFTALRRDAPATRWQVDQFTLDRPRTAVGVLYRATPDTLEPNAAKEIARYLESLLMSSQNTEVVALMPAVGQNTSVSASEIRKAGAELTVSLLVHSEDRRIVVAYEILPENMATTLDRGTVVRSGNGRIRSAVREIARRTESFVPVRGFVVDRRVDEVLISIGGVDAVEPGDMVDVYTSPDGRFIGSAEIDETDDLISVMRWKPDGPDLIGIGDRVVLQRGLPESADTPVPAESPPAAGLVQRLFRLR